MLPIVVPGVEGYNEDTCEFTYGPPTILELEHSLIAISKWESATCKPFLDGEKTAEEMLFYIKCMTINRVKDETVYRRLSPQNVEDIRNYIDAPMTATTIKEPPGAKRTKRGTKITSEVIYAWLVEMNIPFEVQKWHFNRMMMLVRVLSDRRAPKKKMPRNQAFAQQNALNDARRKAKHTTG